MARIFFSYSHDDEQFRDQLEKHLGSLKNEGLIEAWHDRRILAGSDLNREIDDQLERADVVLLLVSASFLSSQYCIGIEMQRALQRHAAKEAVVIPVIVRPCDWQRSPLGSLRAVPLDGKAITTWANFDEAYTDVAKEVRRVVEQRQSRPSAASQQQAIAPAIVAPIQQRPAKRSSNMRLRKEFTEEDKDRFLHEAFESIARYFEESLKELETRHSGVTCRYRRVDANTFTAMIYRDGKRKAECAVRLGGGFGNDSITYSSNAASAGSFNEQLSVEHDDQVLFLKPLGLSFHGSRDAKLSPEQAAEHLWSILITPLQ